MSEINLESYPPEFLRQTTTQTYKVETVGTIEHIEQQVLDPVPAIDLQNLNLEKLGEACKKWGLFRIVNHGIPLTLLTQLQQHSKQIFALPFDSKKELINNPLSYFWGTPALTPAGSAVCAAGGHNNINWVEGLNVPLSQLSLFHTLHPTLHSFRILLEEYGKHVTRIAATLFQYVLQTLNRSPDLQYSDKSYLSESTGFLRVYRYPHCSVTDETWGMKAHTDSSVFSILCQEQVGGLQLLKDDQWIDIHPIPHTLILNLGDMMQAISNDEYKSVTHRVKANKWHDRYSICYFVFPDDESVIRSSNYIPFTYSKFRDQVQQDIQTLGFKVGLDRFKLFHYPSELTD